MAPLYTTRPVIPPCSELPVIKLTNPNIHLRAMRPSDLPACHELRTQIEVMMYTSQTRIDANLDETRTWMARFCDMDMITDTAAEDLARAEMTEKIPLPETVMDLTSSSIKSTEISVDSTDAVSSVSVQQSGDHHQHHNTDTTIKRDTKTVPVSLLQSTHSTKETISAKKRPTFSFALVYREPDVESGDVQTKEGDEISRPALASVSTRKETVIGSLGCHTTEPEAECGYMINKNHWGKGFATQAMKAFLAEWFKLPRIIVEVPASSTSSQEEKDISEDMVKTETTKASCVFTDGTNTVADTNSQSEDTRPSNINNDNDMYQSLIPESLKAIVESTNVGSMRVLEKLGFEYDQSEEIEENGGTVILKRFILRTRIPNELILRGG